MQRNLNAVLGIFWPMFFVKTINASKFPKGEEVKPKVQVK